MQGLAGMRFAHQCRHDTIHDADFAAGPARQTAELRDRPLNFNDWRGAGDANPSTAAIPPGFPLRP